MTSASQQIFDCAVHELGCSGKLCRRQQVDALTLQLRQAQRLLSDGKMMRRLSDGGDNIRKRIAALEQQLSALGVAQPLIALD